MSDLDSLEREIQGKLKAVNERDQRERQVLQAHGADLGHRHDMFSQTAARLITDIIQPRVETLAKHFDNARLGEQRLPQQYCCPCTFTHSNRFPATVNLTIGVAHDDQIRNGVLYCDLDILPIFIKFSPHQETVLPFDQVDEVRVATWVDQRILEFLDTYLQLELSDQYQQQTLVTDPVCGMRIRRSLVAAEQEYRGVTYFFCAERCREKFVADPQNYVSAEPA
jgi:YHS domain-containing protein